MDDQESVSESEALKDLLAMAASEGGLTLETLRERHGLVDLISSKLDLPKGISDFDHALIAYNVILEFVNAAKQSALERLGTTGSPKKVRVFRICAAAELLCVLTDEAASRRARDAFKKTVSWDYESKGQRDRQARAGVWLDLSDKRVRDIRRQLLKEFNSSIEEHLADPKVTAALKAAILADSISQVNSASQPLDLLESNSHNDAEESTSPSRPQEKTRGAIDSKFQAIVSAIRRRRSVRFLLLVVVSLAVLLAIPLFSLSYGIQLAIQHLLPKPVSEPLRSISSIIDGPYFREVLSVFLAIGIVVLVGLFFVRLRSPRSQLLSMAVLFIVCVVWPIGTWFEFYVSTSKDFDRFTDREGKRQDWQTVTGQEFDTVSDCNALKDSDSVLVSECKIERGSLHFGAHVKNGTGRLLYPQPAAASEVSSKFLYGDFLATTRFRAVGSTRPSSCALMLRDVTSGEERFLRLDERPKDRYPGYGAELVSWPVAADDITSAKASVDVATSTTLPYVMRPLVFEAEYSEDGPWTTLGIARHGDAYQLFVNRRLVAEYMPQGKSTPMAVYLAVLAGTTKSGGTATCEFDFFDVYSAL